MSRSKARDLKPRLTIEWMELRSLVRSELCLIISAPLHRLDGPWPTTVHALSAQFCSGISVNPHSFGSGNTDSPESGLTALANCVASFSTGACPGSAVECLITFRIRFTPRFHFRFPGFSLHLTEAIPRASRRRSPSYILRSRPLIGNYPDYRFPDCLQIWAKTKVPPKLRHLRRRSKL